MKPLESRLEHREDAFDHVRDVLSGFRFNLGGNWDYNHGCFDRSLDEANKVFLRIPFQVTHGAIDSESDSTGATVTLGRPYVLKHIYNEGLDSTADASVAGAMVDQFQEPLDPDAEVDEKWVIEAKDVLSQVEKKVLH
jgi:hypothetical protein